jgi:hypothetical protein
MKTTQQALDHFQGKDATGKSVIHYMTLFYGEILRIVCEDDRKRINAEYGW